MKRLLKIVFSLIAAMAVLLVAAAFVLPMIYDTEDLKRSLSTQFREQTGRELNIAGELDFTVFPWLAVQVADLDVNNAAGFSEQVFANIDQARVGVALMPLLSGEIVVDEITLDGLDLALEVNREGRTNWDDFAQSGGNDESGTGESMFSLQEVAGLRFANASISYRDAQAGLEYKLTDVVLQTGALGTGQPLPLEISALLEDVAAGSKWDIDLTTDATIDMGAERYGFNDLKLTIADPANPGAAPLSLSSPAVAADLAAETLGVESFTAELSVLTLSGSMSANDILGEPAFSGQVKSSDFSIKELMSAMAMEPIATTDPGALERVRFQAAFKGSGSEVELNPITLGLDDSAIDGTFSLRSGDVPRIRFEFQVDQLDVDRYLAPAEEEAEAEVAIPRDEVRGVDVNGSLNVAEMTLAGLSFSDATVGVNVRNGQLRLNPLQADFYGGTYSGDVRLDGSGNTPVVSLDEKLDSVTFQNLIGDLVDTQSLSGMALGHIKLTGTGTTSSDLLKSLNGEIGLTLTEGALEGINVWWEIRRAYSLYKGLPAPDPEPERTVFSKMQLSANVADGVVNTRELVGELPFLTLRGNGAIDLGNSAVDMGLVAAVRDVPELNDDPLTADLGGKQLPFKIAGSFSDPGISVDWGKLIQSEATDMLLDKLLGGEDEEQAEGEAGDGEAEPDAESDDGEDAVSSLFKLIKKDKKKDPDKE